MTIVLITGASSGIGLEVARQLMEKGMKVYAASRRGGNSERAEKGAGEIIPVKMDINVQSDILSAIERIEKDNGKLDVVICNAGNGIAGSIEDTSEEEMRYQLETNFFGTVKTIQGCLPLFRKQGYGKIIVTSSVAAIVPLPFQGFYSAGKAALSILMEALSMEVKSCGIQCCTVLPGDTRTEFTSARTYCARSQDSESFYYEKMNKSLGKMEKDEKNGMEASFVAGKIVKQVTRKRMKTRVVPGLQYKLICGIYNFVPLRLRLWIVGKLY